MTPGPELAIVVPTRARPTRLAFTLEALAEVAPAVDIEVVVVRDEDDPSPMPQIEGLALRSVTGPARGSPALKRNLGWRAASAPLVAFTDDDCRPVPGWPAALVAAWREADDDDLILHGPVEPDPDELPLLTGLARSLSAGGGDRWFPTANLCLPRALLERLGGFDEEYTGAGEDTDLALRALAGGAERRFVEEALVWHAVHTRTLAGALREARRGKGLGLLMSRHPRQRREILLGVFWKRSHATALLGAVGIALLARGRPVTGTLALAPFVVDSYDPGPSPTAKHLTASALHIPVRFAIDFAETAATVRGSLAAGTIVI